MPYAAVLYLPNQCAVCRECACTACAPVATARHHTRHHMTRLSNPFSSFFFLSLFFLSFFSFFLPFLSRARAPFWLLYILAVPLVDLSISQILVLANPVEVNKSKSGSKKIRASPCAVAKLAALSPCHVIPHGGPIPETRTAPVHYGNYPNLIGCAYSVGNTARNSFVQGLLRYCNLRGLRGPALTHG